MFELIYPAWIHAFVLIIGYGFCFTIYPVQRWWAIGGFIGLTINLWCNWDKLMSGQPIFVITF